ncbi:MAG: BamA/TamA family outer membrane protein [Gemmatimonadota bacterium]|nr:MAG: BamA/TamA family outer membrane protein [Gemmatimonadota bacterium]
MILHPTKIPPLALAAGLAFAAAAYPAPGPAQQADPGEAEAREWNSPRARELARRAVARRASWAGDEEFRDYRARAQGHIYFLYDLGTGTDRHLVKADQLALDLWWRAPDQSRQLIVGRREEKALPTDIRYHLDHLTVVMDNLGDRIRLGEGSEVRDALHPAASGALDYYEYRLADSLALLMPDREIQVYKLELRPQDPGAAGLVGALYLDKESADIVRMDVTFTAASYIDQSLDYFNIRLENALWGGRYWLPYRQGIELRREVELLKFPAGGIIRAEFKISGYEFNIGTPESFFRGPVVTELSRSQREAFEFDDGLYDALDPEVAVAPPSMAEIREQAAEIISETYLHRIEGLRFAVPGVSSVLRFRRAEGLYLGVGLNQSLPRGASALVLAGYALGASEPQVQNWLKTPLTASLDLEFGLYWQRLADVAPFERSSGAIATLAALIDGEDYREPYLTSGGVVTLGRGVGKARAAASLAWEDWDSASLTADQTIDRGYRDVRELDAGEVAWLAIELERSPAMALETVGGTSWSARVEAASSAVLGDFEYVYAALRAGQVWPDVYAGVDLSLSASAGAVAGGGIPAQRLFPAGGRGTVRGYDFNGFAGNLFSAAGLELSRAIHYPFVSLAVFADIGWVGSEGESARRALESWNQRGATVGPSRGPLLGAGAGLGLIFDILWIELAKGLRQDGVWELVIEVRREFWDWL